MSPLLPVAINFSHGTHRGCRHIATGFLCVLCIVMHPPRIFSGSHSRTENSLHFTSSGAHLSLSAAAYVCYERGYHSQKQATPVSYWAITDGRERSSTTLAVALFTPPMRRFCGWLDRPFHCSFAVQHLVHPGVQHFTSARSLSPEKFVDNELVMS